MEQNKTNTPDGVHNTPFHLKFISFKPESFARINKDMDLFFVLDANKPIMGLEGDQGEGKTSLLNCLAYLMGGDEPINAINSIDKNKKAELVFENTINNRKYIAKCTKSSFSVSRILDEDGEMQMAPEKKPKEFLRDLIGPVGISPMFLKQQDSDEQLKWIRGLYKFTPDDIKVEQDILSKRKSAYSQRTVINRDIKRLRGELMPTNYFSYNKEERSLTGNETFEKHKLFYKQDTTERQKAVSEEFEAAQKLSNDVAEQQKDLDKNKLTLQKNEVELEALKRRIFELEGFQVELKDTIATSEKFIADNKGVEEKLEAAKDGLKKAGDWMVQKANMENIEKAYDLYNSQEEDWKNKDSLIAEYDQKYKEFIKIFTPNIPEMEVCIASDIDVAAERENYMNAHPDAGAKEVDEYVMNLQHETREGIYYKGHSIAELSESELWDLCIQLWRVQGVQVILVENITNLGSQAVERINSFVADGGKVFYSAMDRTAPKLTVTFYDKIK